MKKRVQFTTTAAEAPGIEALWENCMRMPLPLAIVGGERQLLEVNEAFCQLLGYSRREVLLLRLPDIVRREDLAKDEELTHQILVGDSLNFTQEAGYVRRDGEIVWVHVAAVAYHGEGHSGSSLRILRDISDSRRMTAALETQADNFRLLFDSSMEGALIHDNGTILLVNQSLCDMLAYSSDEMNRLGPSELFTPESRGLVRRHFEGGNVYPLDVDGLRKNGTTIPVRVRVKGIAFNEHRARLTIIQRRLESKPIGSGVEGTTSIAKPLSPREVEVFRLLVRGIDNLVISRELGISRRTVEHHVSHILTKLGTANRTAAVLIAHETGLLAELGY